jgi:DNA-binding NarL/FixJ family response regulator/signal transduction histidine kinase
MIDGSVIDRLRRVDQARLDVALAVVLAVVTLLPLWLVPASAGGRDPDILANVLALAMTLPIAFRRRWPVPVLAITVLATILATLTGPSSGVGLAVLIAMYSVAAHADRRQSLAALTLTMIAVAVVVTLVLASSDPGLPPAIYPIGLVLVCIIVGAVWLLGDLVRSRGEAVEELRQRNAELEVEREENARLAVADERARIARELHDAVAHSLSVMVVQAGAARRALETAEPGGEVAAERARGALATIEATGRDTLGEMRRVVGALRPTGEEPYEPQPSLDELDRLSDHRPRGRPAGRARGRGGGAGRPAERRPVRVPGRPGGADEHAQARPRHVSPRPAALRRRRARRGGHGRRPRRGGADPGAAAPGLRAGRHARAGCDGGRRDRRAAGPERRLRGARPAAAGTVAVTDRIRLVIADDQPLLRTGFRMILEAERDMAVVGEAGNGEEAVALTRRLQPDVVLMDIRMPVMDGVEATRRITSAPAPASGSGPRVLILTTFDLDEYIVQALRAGASGFLLKDVPPEELAAAIRVVAAGDALLAPSITRRLLDRFASTFTVGEVRGRRVRVFTERELECSP